MSTIAAVRVVADNSDCVNVFVSDTQTEVVRVTEVQPLVVNVLPGVLVNIGEGGPGTEQEPVTHTQITPVAVWTFNHNLGYRPAIKVFSVGGVEIKAKVLNVSNNQAQIRFNRPTVGSAIAGD